MPTRIFPDSKELTREDKPHFDELFRRLQPRISEMTFANLFLFRKPHRYRVTRFAGSTVVLGHGYSGDDYFLPPLGEGADTTLDRLLGEGMTLYGADDALAERKLRCPGIVLSEDRDNADYLYLRSDLADLPGSRFHKKKNRLNYFTSRHDFRVETYRPEHRSDCLDLLEEWARVRSPGGESSSLAQETAATREGLELAEFLGLRGVVVLVEGRVRGFALGEELNRETSVCHFQKADPFMEGLYQLVDREFNRLLFTGCTYVNREQDLGAPGLRASKLSYNPVGMVRKWRAWKAEGLKG